MRKHGILLATVLMSLAPAGAWQRNDLLAGLPGPRPVTREQATSALLPDASRASLCLTPAIQLAQVVQPNGHLPRTLELLAAGSPFGQERRLHRHDGLVVRYPAGLAVRAEETIPVEVQAGLDGFDRAARLFAGRMQMTPPVGLEIVFHKLDERVDGYAIPAAAAPERSVIVLNVTATDGIDGIRRAAMHQYAHLVTLRPSGRFPEDWGEALATWAVIALEGSPRPAVVTAIDERLADRSRGWFDTPAGDPAGNAIWFDFIDRMYGLVTVRTVVDELALRADPAAAFERAVRAATGSGLDETLREFHLWSVLTAERATGHHFPYAARLAAPVAASSHEGLPALSIHSDAPVPAGGSAQIRLYPEASRGGLELRFEGELGTRWQADLLLFDRAGRIHRLPVELADGDGGETVTVEGIVEVLVLVRNLGGDDATPRTYTYTAHLDAGYPCEFTRRSVDRLDGDGGRLVTWDTASERDLVGFDILRTRVGSDRDVKVNPVRIPALGEPDFPTSYSFVDRNALRGAAYEYKVQAVTRDGLKTTTDAFLRSPEDD